MPVDLDLTLELTPFRTGFWWFVHFLFGSNRTATADDAFLRLTVMLIIISLILFVGWKFVTWVGRLYYEANDSSS